jgi:hypothetical protein
MTKVVRFLLPDEALQRSAREQGLFVARDKFDNWFLQILDALDDGTMNPHFVAAYVTRQEVETYLRARHERHQELGPSEVYGAVLSMADGDEVVK